ncbi:MAG: hypothetical protein IJA34_00405 [Lachnospiraceae bacterium]|nr:hypothetical protein [Lachnospiraceae bacterium]
MPKCPYAVSTDEYHGWECSITGDSCLYLFPTSNCEYLDKNEEDTDNAE